MGLVRPILKKKINFFSKIPTDLALGSILHDYFKALVVAPRKFRNIVYVDNSRSVNFPKHVLRKHVMERF